MGRAYGSAADISNVSVSATNITNEAAIIRLHDLISIEVFLSVW